MLAKPWPKVEQEADMKVQHRLKSTLSVRVVVRVSSEKSESPDGDVTLIIAGKAFELNFKTFRFQGVVCLDASANVSLQLVP